MLHNGAADRVDPFLFLLLGISNEVHGVLAGGEFKSKGFIECVFGTFDSKAIGDGNDASGNGILYGRIKRILKPQQFSLFQNKPTAAPGFDVLALLGEPAGPLRIGPEIYAVVVGGVGISPGD